MVCLRANSSPVLHNVNTCCLSTAIMVIVNGQTHADMLCARCSHLCDSWLFKQSLKGCSAQHSKLLLADTGLSAHESEQVGCSQAASAQGGHVGGDSDAYQPAPSGSQSQVHASLHKNYGESKALQFCAHCNLVRPSTAGRAMNNIIRLTSLIQEPTPKLCYCYRTHHGSRWTYIS